MVFFCENAKCLHSNFLCMNTWIFSFVPPRLLGTYYLHPLDTRAISLHNDLLCNGTWSVTGGGGGGGA